MDACGVAVHGGPPLQPPQYGQKNHSTADPVQGVQGVHGGYRGYSDISDTHTPPPTRVYSGHRQCWGWSR